MIDSTVTGNTSVSTGGGIASYTSNYISAANSLIALNGNGRGFDDDCKNKLYSRGYNLIGVTAGCTISNDTGNPSANDQTGVADPGLGALGDNGGPTFTHALLAQSPAIDSANPAGCTDRAGAGLVFDQRGENRTVDGDGNQLAICDVGAVEHVPEPAATALCASALVSVLALARRRRVRRGPPHSSDRHPPGLQTAVRHSRWPRSRHYTHESRETPVTGGRST